MLLDNAVQAFLLLADMERRLAPGTVTLYRSGLSALCAFVRDQGKPRLEDLTPNLLRAAAAAQMQDHADRPTNWRGGEAMGAVMVAACRTMCRRLHEEYPELPLPDLSMVKAPRVPERIQPRLENDEFARLEAALRMRLLRDRVPRFLIARDLAILEVLANTGLRAAECCGLDLSDVDLEEGTVRVRHGKGNKQRILTVKDPDPNERDGGEVCRALQDYLRYRHRVFGDLHQALWLTPKGNRLNTNGLRNCLSALCVEAGLDGNRPPHAFRRAHFTEQYRDQPGSLPVLVERMGWDSDAMARVYTRGVRVELARRIQLPLMSKKWRSETQPLKNGKIRPIVERDVGLEWSEREERPAAALGRKATSRPTAKPAKGLRSLS